MKPFPTLKEILWITAIAVVVNMLMLGLVAWIQGADWLVDW